MPKSKRKRRTHSKCGYFGVRKAPNGKYEAVIRACKNGRVKYLGSSYVTAQQAAKVYDKEAIKLRKANLNFPKSAPVGYKPIKKALRSDNKVGYRGVSQNVTKFYTYIKIAGIKTYHGTYDTAKEAAIAYDRVVLKSKLSTSLLNFPDMVHNLDVEPKRKYKRSSTGYKGLQREKNGRFNAKICTNGKNRYIGTFDTDIEAALAYDQAAIKAGRKNSTLNFPMDQKLLLASCMWQFCISHQNNTTRRKDL